MNLREAFSLIWKIGIATAVIIYLVRFNELSETELVRLSYIWIPVFVFGLAGSFFLRSPRFKDQPPKTTQVILVSLVCAISAAGILMFFYETIWPEL